MKNLGNLDEEHTMAIPIKTISPAEFEAGIQKSTSCLILDVRRMDEYEASHLKRAILIPLEELWERKQEITEWREKPVYIYCRSGRRSLMAAGILMVEGFTDILDLGGGIIAWEAEEKPAAHP